jgi:amino acid transporter
VAFDGIMPPIFSKLNRFGVPGNAITLNYLLALAIIFADLPILFLGTISSVVIHFAMSLVAGACLKIEKQYPEEFNNAPFKLPNGMLRFLSFYTIISAALLTIISFTEDLLIMFLLVFWTILGIGYYCTKKSKSG